MKYLERFKNPGVLVGLVGLFVQLFILFGYELDDNWINTVAVTICNILVVLGIMNNPDTSGVDLIKKENLK